VPLKNRRQEYSWAATGVRDVRLQTDKKTYSSDEKILANSSFKIVGGLRESFHPDVWTMAWEDYDKILRLTYRVKVSLQRGLISTRLASIDKAVRKASFYWSRDPDLPYRIWAMIVPEDGGPPKIPVSVEDAKSKMLDFTNTFEVQASTLSKGTHSLVATGEAKWGRRSFIEQGSASGKSKPVVITVE